MEIIRDDGFANRIKKLLLDDYQKTARAPDGKFHISELLQPRQAYFTRKYGREMTEQDICMFIPGSAFHEYLQKVLGNEFAEKKINFMDDITGTIDWSGTYILELKTSRKWVIPDMPEKHYVSQVCKYMAMEHKLEGYILVIYFTAGRSWDGKKPSTLELMAWKIIVTPKEQEDDLASLVDTRSKLIEASTTGDFSTLPLCYEFSCFSEYKKEVTRVCPFYGLCEPDDRYNKKAFEFWKNLHATQK